MMKKLFIYLPISISLFILDQLSKVAVVKNFALGESKAIIKYFNITYVQNTGTIFGFLNGEKNFIKNMILIILPLGICAYIIYSLIQSIKKNFTLSSVAYSLILGGALGNMYDRIFRGFVVDFLDFYFKDYHWYCFNIADSCITIGITILLFDQYLNKAQT